MSKKGPLDYQLNTTLGSNKINFLNSFIDPLLVISICTVLVFGLFILYSASGQSKTMVFLQAIYIGFGLIFMFIISRLDERIYKSFLVHLFWLGLVLLLWVLFFPAEGYETNRWIDLGFISFQPSELLRLFLPLAVASFLTRKKTGPFLKDWFIVILAISICSFLILKQPDLGTSLIVFSSGLIPVLLSGFPLSILLIFLVFIVALSPLIWGSLKLYQQERILTYLNPESDPLGTGFQIAQSKIAIGSGGVTGKGYLLGTQSHLEFLPLSHSDFILAVLGEEFGFLGIGFIFLFYGLILFKVFSIGFGARTEFARLTVSSIGFIFLIYILVNVSMVVGIMPVVGVPLPLISQGGTSILIHLIAFGFVLSMKKRQTW